MPSIGQMRNPLPPKWTGRVVRSFETTWRNLPGTGNVEDRRQSTEAGRLHGRIDLIIRRNDPYQGGPADGMLRGSERNDGSRITDYGQGDYDMPELRRRYGRTSDDLTLLEVAARR